MTRSSSTYDYGQQSNLKWFQRTFNDNYQGYRRAMLSSKTIDYQNKSKPGTKTYNSVVKIQSLYRGYCIRNAPISTKEKIMKAWFAEQQFAGVRVKRV